MTEEQCQERKKKVGEKVNERKIPYLDSEILFLMEMIECWIMHAEF